MDVEHGEKIEEKGVEKEASIGGNECGRVIGIWICEGR